MKIKLFYLASLVGVCGLAITYMQADASLSSLQLENVEALSDESSGETDYSMTCFTQLNGDQTTMNIQCSDCSFHWGVATSSSETKRCTNSH